MSADPRTERLARRIAELYASDQQFAAARPDETITAQLAQPDLRLFDLVRLVMEGYADRPALGQRATRRTPDPATGRARPELLPYFETITYRQAWDRAGALADAMASSGVGAGHRVCVLGFSSIDYATIELALVRLGAVAVPLQTSAPVSVLQPIVAETEPTVIAASVDDLPTAVRLVTGHSPALLLVFDHDPEIDDHREALASARSLMAEAGSRVAVTTVSDLVERGNAHQAAAAVVSDDDPLSLLIYTSGTTGTPKGAMYSERLVMNLWRGAIMAALAHDVPPPTITLNFLPMSHGAGRGALFGTLGSGGTAYFAASRDLSSLLEDLALVRPTQLSFVPRIWEMLFQEFQSTVQRRAGEGVDRTTLEAAVMAEHRQSIVGGRYTAAMSGSAPISAELKTFAEAYLDLHLADGYGATETGVVTVDGHVRRPPVLAYKLADIPELGYFRTDRPHPRGELLIKSSAMFAGYYRQPDATATMYDDDGFYRTGDVVAEAGPDRLVYVDRRYNVLKLSQGEFVTVAKLETVFADGPVVENIYVRQQRALLPSRRRGADRKCARQHRGGFGGPQVARPQLLAACREDGRSAVLRDPT